MSSSGVSARLLPLMDISMLLLGMLMVMMAYSQVKVEETVSQSADQSPMESYLEEGVVVVPMVPMVKGQHLGKLALLDEDFNTTGYLDPNNGEEFKALLRQRGLDPSKQIIIALLLVKEGDAGFRSSDLERRWDVIVAKADYPQSAR